MTYDFEDIVKDYQDMLYYMSTAANDEDIHTKKVMREETELLLKRQKAIYNILTVVTLVSVLITVKYSLT
jgi:hypothetical protein